VTYLVLYTDAASEGRYEYVDAGSEGEAAWIVAMRTGSKIAKFVSVIGP